jgi:hypothetical protein
MLKCPDCNSPLDDRGECTECSDDISSGALFAKPDPLPPPVAIAPKQPTIQDLTIQEGIPMPPDVRQGIFPFAEMKPPRQGKEGLVMDSFFVSIANKGKYASQRASIKSSAGRWARKNGIEFEVECRRAEENGRLGIRTWRVK